METLREFFANLYHFDALIRWGGYTVLVGIVFAETGLLAGFFLPGDSLLVTAGLLAVGDGPLNIGALIILLSAAAIAGDSTGYAIGYHAGPKIFRREDSRWFRKEHVRRTQRFYDTYGAKTIVLARFMPFVRTFAPTVAGVARMRYRTFVIFNILGGISWVASMTLAGYWLGRSVPHIDRQLHWIILGIIIVSMLPIIREWLVSRHRRHEPA
ncbi:MAG: VTT domain-containing protein [Candidatus Omnitrophica bacterium]|nr:VTT domain-containing protein [Candidatus Omnitrophota bacterium]